MKNSGIVFLLALALGAMSCKKDVITEVQPRETISFQPFTSANSKVSSTTSQSISSYKVLARANNSKYSLFNFDAAYTKSNQGVWSTSGKYYWPADNSARFKFTAFSPTNFANFMEVAPNVTEGSGSVSITGVQPKRQAVEQVDLLVAETTRSRAEGATVPLKFKHVFSQIIIQAQCDDPTVSVEVYGVKLGNIIQSANLLIKNTDANEQLSGIWNTYGEGRTTYISGSVMTSHSPVSLNTSPQNVMFGGGSFMVIPQAPAAWNGTASDQTGAYIALLCRIKKGNLLLYPPTSASMYAYAAVGVGTQWKAGHSYTYTVKFFSNGGGAGKVPPEVTEPSAPGGIGVVDLTPTPGTIVVGGPLSFTVTTTAWADSNTTITPQ